MWCFFLNSLCHRVVRQPAHVLVCLYFHMNKSGDKMHKDSNRNADDLLCLTFAGLFMYTNKSFLIVPNFSGLLVRCTTS